MNNMRIIIVDDKVKVFTPYNSSFVNRIKGINNAKWDAQNKCWAIPAAMIEPVREIMRDVYGCADNDVAETVKIKITALSNLSEKWAPVELLGKVLSKAYGRNSGAMPGDDVAYISGRCSSGGSVKNWRSQVEAGSVIILNNVSKVLYERYLENPNEKLEVELMEYEKSKDELLKEKEQLLTRLKEIEKKLNEYEIQD